MFAFYHEWRHHLRCIITVPYGKTLRMYKVKWMSQSIETFDLKNRKGNNHTYNVVLEKAIVSNKNNPVLFYEMDKTDPIDINTTTNKSKSSRLYNIAFKSKVAEDVLSESKNKTMFIIIALFVIAIIGIGLYSQYMLTEQSDKILQLTKQLTEALLNANKPVIIK